MSDKVYGLYMGETLKSEYALINTIDSMSILDLSDAIAAERSRMVGEMVDAGLLSAQDADELLAIPDEYVSSATSPDPGYGFFYEGFGAHGEYVSPAMLTSKCIKHDWLDNGLRKSWCRTCNVDGVWDAAQMTFVEVQK